MVGRTAGAAAGAAEDKKKTIVRVQEGGRLEEEDKRRSRKGVCGWGRCSGSREELSARAAEAYY